MKTDFQHMEVVEGWLNNKAMIFTSYYTSTFLSSVKFNSLEIGVHHGKFLIGLENITPLGCKAIAIDVFDSQEKNIDSSGKGDLNIFLGHVAQFCVDPNRVIAMPLDSLDVNASEIGINKFGLLSIDGGHTANHTINDLSICERLVNEMGLVILDDILNQDWTGVVTGAVQFFSSNDAKRIVPFAIGYNKLFCCHFSSRDLVLNTLIGSQDVLNNLGIKCVKFTEFAGNKVMSLQ